MGQAYVGLTLKKVPINQGIINYTEPTVPGSPDGTLILPEIQAYFNNDNTIEYSGSIKLSTIAAGTTGSGGIPALTDGAINYVVVEWNNGSPRYNVLSSNATINRDGQIFPYVTACRNGTDVFWIQWDNFGLGLAEKTSDRLVRTNRFAWESGLGVTSDGAGQHVIVGSGYSWHGPVRQFTNSFTSASTQMYFWYHSAGNWTYSLTNTYDNLQYDDGTNLQTLTIEVLPDWVCIPEVEGNNFLLPDNDMV